MRNSRFSAILHGKPKGGRFGPFGGRYVPETLMEALIQLEEGFIRCWTSRAFQAQFHALLRDFGGRPTPLYRAWRLEERYRSSLPKSKRTKIYLKREDLCHTGAHKINNCVGQALLALHTGKKRIVAETGAGQHGVATAAVCAHFELSCHVYMGKSDMERQAPNVSRMRLMGAEVIPVTSGSMTLNDAINEAIRDWVTHVDTTHYLLGSVVGPHPYPWMVREFQSVIGQETFRQILDAEGRLPEAIVACVGGGSNAIGMFAPFLPRRGVKLFGVEAGGKGNRPGENAASLGKGKPGILHGSYSYVLQNSEGQIQPTHSISAGLDYPGVGPEHAWLKEIQRVDYVTASDREALQAFQDLARYEGILPALEPAHALAFTRRLMRNDPGVGTVIVNLSGRGDKDLTLLEEQAS
jgi:tryptophan synthase beta chain